MEVRYQAAHRPDANHDVQTYCQNREGLRSIVYCHLLLIFEGYYGISR